ncbi:MAG: ATP-binding protein, partial [Proteobacteria bacterium]|nr:ATP-binding protein [Pseudomonadota bacterium]
SWYGWGPWGCGKTHLAAAHLRESLIQTGSGLFVEAPMFFLELTSTFGHNGSETAKDVFERYIKTPLLVFDDLDKVKLSEWVCRGLFLILNGRWSARRLTIITANVERKKMIERIKAVDWELAGAIDSRLKALCPEVPLSGRDRRDE